jgi:DMSO/TMAO reductase YedYZ molybdopterin-dependent catalytic subunit
MRRPSVPFALLLGALTSLPLIALSYLGAQWASLPFFPFDLFDWLARVLPGRAITAGIDTIVRLVTLLGLGPIDQAAKRVEQAMGIVMVVVGGAVIGLIVALVIRRSRWSGRNVGAVAGLVGFAFVAGVELALGTPVAGDPVLALLWLAVLIVGWATLLGTWLAAAELSVRPEMSDTFRADRRALLLKLAGGSVGAALAAWGIGQLIETSRQAQQQARSVAQGTAASQLPAITPPATPSGRIAPAPGTRSEVTSNENFYRIDINTRPPVIDAQSWTLQVAGLFDHPRPLTLANLFAYPAVTQPITLSCISNPIGGSLISTSYWTGVRLRVVLEDLGLRPETKALFIQAVDGFYESVTMEDMMDPRTLLVYGMNGDVLPIEHGFPLRIYIPNRYGMKQPKWMTHMTATDQVKAGYWVERDWSAQARPHIVSIIDTVATDESQNGQVPVGGIAWAGDRGIQKVEVQVDGGEWAEATLRIPPLGPLTWVQWRYDWPAASGRHAFRVRATDGTGALQIEKQHSPFPDGATGYDSAAVAV